MLPAGDEELGISAGLESACLGQEELGVLYEYRSQRIRVVARDVRALIDRYNPLIDQDSASLLTDVASHLDAWARAYDDEAELVRRGGSGSSTRIIQLRLGPSDDSPTDLLRDVVAAVDRLRQDASSTEELRGLASRCQRFLDGPSAPVLVHFGPGTRATPPVMEIVRAAARRMAQ